MTKYLILFFIFCSSFAEEAEFYYIYKVQFRDETNRIVLESIRDTEFLNPKSLNSSKSVDISITDSVIKQRAHILLSSKYTDTIEFELINFQFLFYNNKNFIIDSINHKQLESILPKYYIDSLKIKI